LIIWAFFAVFGITIGGSILYLFIYQYINGTKNITTIEDFIEGVSDKKPFDKGRNKNFEEIFGKGYGWKNILFPLRN